MKIARHLSELEGETPFGYSRDETTNGCAFHRKCWEVLSGHSGIHAAHFDHKWDRCFCSSCMGSRGDRPTYSGGSHGPGTYVLPRGYAKFALKIDAARADARGFWTEWSNTYHGTKLAALKDIVECGYLLVPGNRNHKGVIVATPRNVTFDDQHRNAAEGKQADQAQIFTSPRYAHLPLLVRPTWPV